MVEMGDMNGLMYQQQERPPVCWISVCHRPGYGLILSIAKRWVICLNEDWSVIILEDVRLLT